MENNNNAVPARFGPWLDRLRWSTTGRRTAAAERFTRAVVSPWARTLFRPSWTGLEHLPRDRPFMLVANHSAGIAIAELASFATLWTSGEVSALPLAGFAHPVGFRSAPGRWVHRHAGSAPSTYGAAHEALRSGVSLLVFPGGDHECLRPLSRAHEVDFAGRTGFLRIARDSGVPIIPMGIRNSHFTVPIAGRSRLLARLLVLPGLLYGVKNWTISVNSVIGAAAISLLPWPVWARVAAAWLWLSSPFIFVPVVPATIRFSIGPPLEPVDLFGEDRQRPLGDALADVTARVQQQVDAGASRRSRRQA